MDDAMYWFAPEVLRGMEFTVMTDVWAFGCTIWELFQRGLTPFSEYEDWSGKSNKRNIFRKVTKKINQK